MASSGSAGGGGDAGAFIAGHLARAVRECFGRSLSLARTRVYPAPSAHSTHMTDLYKALDFYNVDELYSDEERMIRDTVRSWVSDRFMPVIEEHNRAATFPTHLIP